MNTHTEAPITRVSESHDPYADFIRVELTLSFTFADLAETNFRIGHSESAQRALQKAQRGCETLERFLNNENHAKHLTGKEKDETVEAWELLRERLNSLERIQSAKTITAMHRRKSPTPTPTEN